MFVFRARSYLTYIKLWTVVKRNESMAQALQAKLKEPQTDENKRGPRPQDLIRLYEIILQVHHAHTHIPLPVLHFYLYCFSGPGGPNH